MTLDPSYLTWCLRRLVRRTICRRFGHSWRFDPDYVYCRACRISGHDAYYRRRRAVGYVG